MINVFVDFSFNQTSDTSALQHPEVIRLLKESESPFISSNPLDDNPTRYKKTLMGLKKERVKVRFSHSLVRTGANQWHVIHTTNRGEGGFGAVNESKLKLVVHEKSIQMVEVRDVVKVQKGSRHMTHSALLTMARDEAEFQRQHGVQVYEVVDSGDKIITVLEDCGTSLDKLFPLSKQYDFNYRLAIATRLGSEMLLLRQHDVVHRDLKPANICLKLLGNGSFQIIFIDFGLSKNTASSGNYEAAGTYHYMAPEILTSKSSPASDMYAFAAILGELFGANHLLKFKEANLTIPEFLKAPYCFDGLFGQYDCSKVDPFLLNDFRTLLEKLGSRHPQDRPTINHLNKFLVTIPARILEYNKYEQQYKLQGMALNRMDALHQQLTGFKKENIPLNDMTAFMKTNQKKILKTIAETPAPASHYLLSKRCAENNVIADLSGVDCPFPKLDANIALIEHENLRLKQSITRFQEFVDVMSDQTKWNNTNSTGIQSILHCLNSSISPVEKLKNLHQIGQEKTQAGFLSFNWYSRSSLFGKGRHRNVERLYQLLANLDVKNSQTYLAQEQLAIIEEFVKANHFLHGQNAAYQSQIQMNGV